MAVKKTYNEILKNGTEETKKYLWSPTKLFYMKVRQTNKDKKKLLNVVRSIISKQQIKTQRIK